MRAANVRRISRPQTNSSHLICMRAANPRRTLNKIYKRVASYLLKSEVAIVGLRLSDGHTCVYSLHRYRYRYIVSNDRYKRTPSVICL
jgi:hypothetical protein